MSNKLFYCNYADFCGKLQKISTFIFTHKKKNKKKYSLTIFFLTSTLFLNIDIKMNLYIFFFFFNFLKHNYTFLLIQAVLSHINVPGIIDYIFYPKGTMKPLGK